MTELLYLKDSYMKECDAEVVEINKEDSTIILDKTIFYPKGGGQECDKGEIETPDGKIRVIWVDKKDGKVRHEVDDIGLSLKPGSKIKLFEMTMLSPDVLSQIKKYKTEGKLEEDDWNPWIEKQEKIIQDKKWYEATLSTTAANQ